MWVLSTLCLINPAFPPPHSFSPDIFSSVSVPPSLKVCLDLSAEYLILSDVQRKVGCSGAPWAELVLSGKQGCWAHPQHSQPLSQV